MKRGPLWEKQVVEFLRANGFPDAERRVMGGANDRGDVAGVKGWTLECKALRQAEWGAGLTEAEREAKRAGTTRFALIQKRRQKGVAEGFAILPVWLLAELMREDA